MSSDSAGLISPRPAPAGAPDTSTPSDPARLSAILDRRGVASPGFSKVRHAYAVLRGEILDGVLKPGEWLRMSPIADRLNLSEMPVREALRLLEKDGLVSIHLHRGAQVAALSFEQALEITEVRMTLEGVAAEGALPAHDPESVRALRQALARQRAAAEDRVTFAVQNRAFAEQIYERCPNRFLREHIRALWDQGWQHSSTAVFEVMRHRVEDTLRENEAIVAALAAQGREALRAAYAVRLERSIEAWRRAIAERRPAQGA